MTFFKVMGSLAVVVMLAALLVRIMIVSAPTDLPESVKIIQVEKTPDVKSKASDSKVDVSGIVETPTNYIREPKVILPPGYSLVKNQYDVYAFRDDKGKIRDTFSSSDKARVVKSAHYWYEQENLETARWSDVQ